MLYTWNVIPTKQKTNTHTHTAGVAQAKNLDMILFTIRRLIISCFKSDAFAMLFWAYSSDVLITILWAKSKMGGKKHTYLRITRQFVGEF